MTLRDGVVVRELRLSDIETVGALVRDSFVPELAPYMVATQPGWTRFLALALLYRESFPTQRLTVVEREGRVVAFADYRVHARHSGFLSYICVASDARGAGLGRLLFTEAVRRHGPVNSVALDVFADNAPAVTLYRSMGFRDVACQEWWRRPLSAVSEVLALDGLPASMASLVEYGFCEVSGERDGRRFRYGRMGRSVLRAFSAADYNDGDLSAALAGTFPELREIFATLPGNARPPLWGGQPFNTTIRMSADTLTL